MPDSDRFEGIAAALSAADAERLAEAETPDPPGDQRDDRTDGTPDPSAIQTPAFSFDETVAHSIYVRPETLEAVDDVEALVDARLRTEREVRNLTTREFFEALLQVATDDPDCIIDAVVRNRRPTAVD